MISKEMYKNEKLAYHCGVIFVIQNYKLRKLKHKTPHSWKQTVFLKLEIECDENFNSNEKVLQIITDVI